MALEIERKFLVDGDFRSGATSSRRIVQGYICATAGKSVRVRIRGEEGFLTIKGPTVDEGMSRYEFEQSISLEDAERLLELCEPTIMEKVRYLVPVGTHTWEVDVFKEENDGLIMAELELTSPDEEFLMPDWAGKEVTGDPRYYNAMLSRHPYKEWKDK